MKQTLVSFVPDMVLAINEDRKTMTRRIVNVPMSQSANGVRHYKEDWYDFIYTKGVETYIPVRCPFGQPGDRIGVRERARVMGYPAPGLVRICYMADGIEAVVPWPSRLRHVKIGNCIPNGCHREAVRTWTEITAVRVERLNEISRGDCMQEGCQFPNMAKETDPKKWFSDLWESVYGLGSFDDRWVWMVEFKRVEGGAP